MEMFEQCKVLFAKDNEIPPPLSTLTFWFSS